MDKNTRLYAKIRRDGFSSQPIDIDVWREIKNDKGKVIENRIFANAEQFSRKQQQLEKIYEIEDLADRMDKLEEHKFFLFGDYPRETFKTLKLEMYDSYLSLSKKEQEQINIKALEVGIIAPDDLEQKQARESDDTYHNIQKAAKEQGISMVDYVNKFGFEI